MTGNIPELIFCLGTLRKCWSARARSLNVLVLWPLLHEIYTLYCRPKRRWEIKRRSLTCARRSTPWWKRFSNASIKPRMIVYPPLLCVWMHVQNCVSVCAYVDMQVSVCVTVCPCHCVLEFKPVYPSKIHLHSGMRNRFKFRDSFQAPLFAVTFKSKSISAAPVVLLLG